MMHYTRKIRIAVMRINVRDIVQMAAEVTALSSHKCTYMWPGFNSQTEVSNATKGVFQTTLVVSFETLRGMTL